ncbi:MAG: M18 family aminopeptidase [Halanaerobiales bacterium]|nr:M18 family aminopeptidase [Halanaerobiales bacterium]
MKRYKYANSLIEYLKKSPTPYHAVDNVKNTLKKEGYKELSLKSKWKLKENSKYFLIKNGSALIAFTTSSIDKLTNGFKIIGAHTDSPGLKIKPNPEFEDEKNYLKINTEVYGGPILSTWFDRPLSLAGRISIKDNDQIKNINIKFDKPLMIIPNLAIHLNREVNQKNKIDKQRDLMPIMATVDQKQNIKGAIIKLISQEVGVDSTKILDFDLYLRDTEPPLIVGSKKEFLSAGQIDDLAMVHASLLALINSNSSFFKLLALFDNEEIGSMTDVGADSPLLNNVIERIVYSLNKSREEYLQLIENSFMVSADMAHAVHPNKQKKHDPTNQPVLNKGLVIKVSSNRKYTTDSYSGAFIKKLCIENKIKYQEFVNNSNQKGGSTIGPINLSHLGVKSVDIGNPVLSMHSIKELTGLNDHDNIIKLMTTFYNS